jgi:hypothetical protein
VGVDFGDRDAGMVKVILQIAPAHAVYYGQGAESVAQIVGM